MHFLRLLCLQIQLLADIAAEVPISQNIRLIAIGGTKSHNSKGQCQVIVQNGLARQHSFTLYRSWFI